MNTNPATPQTPIGSGFGMLEFPGFGSPTPSIVSRPGSVLQTPNITGRSKDLSVRSDDRCTIAGAADEDNDEDVLDKSTSPEDLSQK